MIDLHIHSVYSDGTCTVEEIISKAKDLNLSQIAITDHNILDGSVLGSTISDIDFIIGTELSVGYNGHEVHLLGYFPNGSEYKNVKFVINEGEAYKKVAIMELIENLNEMGIDIKITDLTEFSKGIINRVHVCMAMKKRGYINSIEEGFKNYVGEHCPAYVERKTVSLDEAINAIHADRGIAIIAHPYEYDELNIDDFLLDIIDNIDGIECYHPSATSKQSAHLVDIANKYNKLITGGSDFHGDNKPNINLGMMNVDDKYKINNLSNNSKNIALR